MLLTPDQTMIRDAVRDFAQQEFWPHATLMVTDAVTRMRQTLAQIRPEHAGQFLSYDGSTIAW